MITDEKVTISVILEKYSNLTPQQWKEITARFKIYAEKGYFDWIKKYFEDIEDYD